jgi:hypothetical protein
MHVIMYWVISSIPRAFNAYMKGHVRGSGQQVRNYFFLAASSSSFWRPIITFEQADEKTKWTVTNLCCTNLACTLKPCLGPVVSKRLVSVEFPLLMGNLARLFGNGGGRKSEGLTSSRRIEVVRLRGFILFE